MMGELPDVDPEMKHITSSREEAEAQDRIARIRRGSAAQPEIFDDEADFSLSRARSRAAMPASPRSRGPSKGRRLVVVIVIVAVLIVTVLLILFLTGVIFG
jgi:hypothetical protein